MVRIGVSVRIECSSGGSGMGRERHRRPRVNPLRGSSAGAAALTGDTAPSAAGGLTMPGSGLPAIAGPAADGNAARTPRTGRRLSSRGWASSGRTALLEATWWPWRAIRRAVAVARVASCDTWAAFSETRALSGAFRRWMRPGSDLEAAVSCSRRSGRGGGRGGDRAQYGQDRARQAAGLGDKQWRCFVRKISHPTEACRSVGAERNRGEVVRSSSSHPLCPCGPRRHCSRGVPLAQWNVWPALRRYPVLVSRDRLRIEAFHWVSRSLPDRSPVTAGDAVCRRWRHLPIV